MKYTKKGSTVKVLWYVTNHGLGHAARTIAITRELLKEQSKLKITFVSSGIAKNFLKRSLSEFKDRISFYDSSCDIGLKLKSFDVPDVEKMKEMLEKYLKDSANAIEVESRIFDNHNLVISDALSHAHSVAKKLGIPSVLLSNFT